MRSEEDVLLFFSQITTAYYDTKEKYDQKQALGGMISYFSKRNVSFITKQHNRDNLIKYTEKEICYALIEHVVRRIGHFKITTRIDDLPDVDECKSYKEASRIVAKLLIQYSQAKNKITFGDVNNIIKTIMLHESLRVHLSNQLISDLFVKELEFDDEYIPFQIVYMTLDGEEKTADLDGNKILEFIRRDFFDRK